MLRPFTAKEYSPHTDTLSTRFPQPFYFVAGYPYLAEHIIWQRYLGLWCQQA